MLLPSGMCVNPNCTNSSIFDPNVGCVCPLGEIYINESLGLCTTCGSFSIWNGTHCQNCTKYETKANATQCALCNSTTIFHYRKGCIPCPYRKVKTSPTKCSYCDDDAMYNTTTGECDCPITQVKIAPNRCSRCKFWEVWGDDFDYCGNCKSKTTKTSITTCLPCNETTTFWYSGVCSCRGGVRLSRTTCDLHPTNVNAKPCNDEDFPLFCFFPVNRFLQQCYWEAIGKEFPIFPSSAGQSIYLLDGWILWTMIMVSMFLFM
jgi:hypothetical protein